MNTITLHGFAKSTYVNTARLTLFEKGLDHTLQSPALSSDEYVALHPFRKMPVLQHDDVTLYECLPICIYVDEAFDGTPLQPSNALSKAQMFQWISVYNSYAYPTLINDIVKQRFLTKTPDEARISAAIPQARHILGLMEQQLQKTNFFAGAQLSLADLFIFPGLNYLALTSEATDLLKDTPKLKAFLESMSSRESFQKATS